MYYALLVPLLHRIAFLFLGHLSFFIPEFNKSLIAAADNLCLFSFESGGVEGAIEGRIDLEENYKEKIIIKDSYDWNFNLKENKIYHMDIYLLQK